MFLVPVFPYFGNFCHPPCAGDILYIYLSEENMAFNCFGLLDFASKMFLKVSLST